MFRNPCPTQSGFVIIKDRIKEEVSITFDFNTRVNNYSELWFVHLFTYLSTVACLLCLGTVAGPTDREGCVDPCAPYPHTVVRETDVQTDKGSTYRGRWRPRGKSIALKWEDFRQIFTSHELSLKRSISYFCSFIRYLLVSVHYGLGTVLGAGNTVVSTAPALRT